ncbi:MAG: N-acetylmuramoyl-L-alanine amidase [Desulfobacterales bacterium]|jgi:N-acetylmuramoyl-L-alanine amidase
MTQKAKKLFIISIILLIFGEVSLFSAFSAAAPEDAYFDAEACYRSLRQNPQKIKYRHNWMRCIKKFQSVYRQDPDGPWAAAGLYRSAKMYLDLAKYSGKGSDRKKALDIFQQIAADYPQSRYHQKAVREIHNLGATVNVQKTPSRTAAAGSSAAGTETPKDAYIAAESCYSKLRKNPPKMKYRQNWLRCIDKFQSVYDKDPDGPWAPAGLFMAATLYQKLYDHSYASDDLESAHSIFNQIITRFPDSRYQAKAASAIQKMPGSVKKQQTAEPDPIAAKIEAHQKAQRESIAGDPGASRRPDPGGMSTVTNLRFWSNPNYTRVVIDADREADYTHHLLKKDPSLKKPQRLYVDLSQSRLGKNIRKSIPIHDDLLLDARAGQYTLDSVRVVVDIKSFETYKIFSLKDPFRIVIDVWGTRTGMDPKVPRPSETVKKGGKIPPGSLAKQLALGVRRIVIDPGHGGKDYGAPGYLKGVHEKKVVLQIARKLAKQIRAELGLEVIMTRNGDRFLTLEERTAFANTKNADLFISIQCLPGPQGLWH